MFVEMLKECEKSQIQALEKRLEHANELERAYLLGLLEGYGYKSGGK